MFSTSDPGSRGRPRQNTSNTSMGDQEDLGFAQPAGSSKTLVKPWWRKRGVKESGSNSRHDHHDKPCGKSTVEDATLKQTSMEIHTQAIPTRLHSTSPPALGPASQYMSSVKHKGNAMPREGTAAGCDSGFARNFGGSKGEIVPESHMAAAQEAGAESQRRQKNRQGHIVPLRSASVQRPFPLHSDERLGLHAELEDEATAKRLWQSFRGDERFLPPPKPTLECHSPRQTSQIVVNDDFHWYSPDMHTSSRPSERDAPSFRSLKAASRRDSVRTTPDLFHAADTVQIAGGTFTTAGTVTNITYSVTVPSRSFVSSILPLSSWFNRVKFS